MMASVGNEHSPAWKRDALYFGAIAYTIAIYGPMAMMSIGAGLAFTIWLVARYGNLGADLATYRKSPLFWPSVALGVAGAWSLVWAKVSGLTYRGMQPKIDWVGDLKKAWHLAHPFVLAPVFGALSNTRLRRVVKLWLVLGVASAILGIAQYYFPIYNAVPLPHVLSGEQHKGSGFLSYFYGSYHATGFTGFHLAFASIIGFPAAFALALTAVLYRRERALSKRSLAAGGASILFFIASILTYSKIAWAAMPLTIVLIAILGFKGKPRWALIGAILLASIVWGTSSEVRARFAGAGRTINDRLEIWQANVDMIREFPIFGVGWHHNSELSAAFYHDFNMTALQSHAHNNFLDQWSTTGLVGLVAFLWWNFAAVFLAFRTYKRSQDLLWRTLGLGLVGGWFCLHFNGLTQSNWWDAKVLHQISWVTALSIEAYRRFILPR